MAELIISIVFVWLFFKTLGLAFRVAWSLTKAVAVGLFVLALPLLVICLVWGAMLWLPLAMTAGAWGILKLCT